MDLKLLVNNWDEPLFGRTAKPLHTQFDEIANNPDSKPAINYYKQILLKLVERLPDGYYFPLDHIYNIYLNELEIMLNNNDK